MSKAEVWKYLHDGVVVDISGSVPGEVRVAVSIRYLRGRFPGKGTGFVVTLADCSCFRYEPYEEAALTSLTEMASSGIEILSLESSEPTVVNCVMGTLHLAYTSATVVLDSGEPVSIVELSEASAAYWDEWSARSRAGT